jgi:hypothetical protein
MNYSPSGGSHILPKFSMRSSEELNGGDWGEVYDEGQKIKVSWTFRGAWFSQNDRIAIR